MEKKHEEKEEEKEEREEERGSGLELMLPPELWAMVCAHLTTGELVRMSATCWHLRSLVLSKVRRHTVSVPGLMMPKRSMKRILQFVSTLPCLEFLDLSAWDALSDSMLRYLPQGIEVLNLSFTSITDRGLARLPTTLKGLYVEQTSVSNKGLRHLQRFENLTALDLCGNQGFSVSHIRLLPRTITKLDLSRCYPISESGLEMCDRAFDWETSTWRYKLNKIEWPPELQELMLGGFDICLAQLYGMPSRLEKLDLSNCTVDDFPVDLSACLPRLQVLRLSAATCQRIYGNEDEPIMSLPHGLKALIMPRLERVFENAMLLHIPSSIVHLDISHGSLALLVFDLQVWTSELLDHPRRWLLELPLMLPDLQYINLEHRFHLALYQETFPIWIESLYERNITISNTHVMERLAQNKKFKERIIDPRRLTLAGYEPRPVVPREDDPAWQEFIKMCAQWRDERITWVTPPEVHFEAEDCGESDREVSDGGDDDDEEGSLLFIDI